MRIDLFCIASGPSLTVEDCKTVKDTGIETIAVNDSWKRAPFCHYLYAGDLKYWKAHYDDITIPAEKWTCSIAASKRWGLNLHVANGSFNSGMRALQWGIESGFKFIVLLGYDCSIKNGVHWHGPHTAKNLKNPTDKKVSNWRMQFLKVYELANETGVKVVNCTRDSELDFFEKVKLEDVLQYAK